MVLEITPSNVEFESVELASQVKLTLNNTSSEAVTYRFRLQSKAVKISDPKGSIDGGQNKIILVKYDPNLNPSKDILLSMQLKYTEDKKLEQTRLLPIHFIAEKDMEDDMFKSPMNSETVSAKKGDLWWKKK